MRIRFGVVRSRRPSIATSSRTIRTPRACVSIDLTRPLICAERTGSARMGALTQWVRICASPKPAAASAMPIEVRKPRGSFRKTQAKPNADRTPAGPSQPGGSLACEKYPAMPIPRKTGIQRGQRSRSARRVSCNRRAPHARPIAEVSRKSQTRTKSDRLLGIARGVWKVQMYSPRVEPPSRMC